MRKEIVIIRGDQTESYENFTERIKLLVESLLERNKPAKIKIALTVEQPPAFSVIPFRKNKISIVSMYWDEESGSVDLSEIKGFSTAFRVQEALPVSYVKNWPDGELTPGICLLTLFRKKKEIDYDTFINRWHNGHTPLSLKIHPLWHYSRNVVTGKLDDGPDEWDGIVDEHFRKREDLLNPFKFFGNPAVILSRMIKVYLDVKSFLDYGTIETYLAREIIYKS